jgi:hypothetical protein
MKKAESKKGKPVDTTGVPGELVSLEGLIRQEPANFAV